MRLSHLSALGIGAICLVATAALGWAAAPEDALVAAWPGGAPAGAVFQPDTVLGEGPVSTGAVSDVPEVPAAETELREMRAEYSKVFRDSKDPTKYTALLGSAPLHYRDARGRWQDIETGFATLTGGFAVHANRFRTDVTRRVGDAALVALRYEGVDLRLGAEMALVTEGADGAPIATTERRDGVEGRVDGPRVVFEGALGGDLLVGVTPLQLEELLLLREAPAGTKAAKALVWRETLQLARGTAVRVDGATLAEGSAEGALVTLHDAHGELYRLTTPYAYEVDARGLHGRGPVLDGRYRVIRDGRRLVVEKRFDAEWFASSERTWPVLLDPAVGTTVRTDNTAMHTGVVRRLVGYPGEYERIYSYGAADYAGVTGERLRLYTCTANDQMKDFMRFEIGGIHRYITSVTSVRLQLYLDYQSAPAAIRFNDIGLDLCAYDAPAYGYNVYNAIDAGSNFLEAVLGDWIYNWHTMDLCGTAPTIVRNNRAAGLTYFNVGMELTGEATCGRDVRFHDRQHTNYPRVLLDYTVECTTAADCNDGIACTTDTCDSGRCLRPIASTSCLIGGTCYNNGYYVDQCRRCDTAYSQTVWRPMTGSGCVDGSACTHTDICRADGSCSGTAYACADGKACTSDVCNGAGGCSYPIIGGNCLISGTCYARYAVNPGNSCQECRDDWGGSYTTTWGYDNTHACSDGNACTHTDYCSAGTCRGTGYACDDGRTCTADACTGSGGCTYSLLAGNCLISGTCYVNGQANPANRCQVCATSTSTGAWSNAANGSNLQQCWPCTSGGSATAGVCRYGTQTCLNGSYGACSGYTCAGTETCNNQDDDCDGGTDEGLAVACSDGLACTDDGCTTGSCYHNVQADKCLIGGVCFNAGQVNPSNACQLCNPNASRTTWSSQPTTVACAADSYACTDDRCDGGGACIHPIKTGQCLIAGGCYADGAASGSCHECEPSASQTAWTYMTNKVCNDGNACSHTDKCVAAGTGCAGTTYSCNDNRACTTDVCNGTGGCTNPINAGYCLVAGTCYNDDALNPGNDCQWCDPTATNTAFTNRALNAGCAADLYSCTNDVCNGSGTCTHPLATGKCFIGNTCYDTSAANPSNPCQECNPTLSTSAWSNKAVGAACPADALTCTNDICNGAGVCTHPTASGKCLVSGVCFNDDAPNPANECQWCDPAATNSAWTAKPSGMGCTVDAYACTQDICNGASACTHPIIAGNCLVGSVCYANNANNPANDCQRCASTTTQTAWTNKASGEGCAADSYTCTNDICNGSGACTHPTQSTKCLIAGQCYDSGASCSPSVISLPGRAVSCTTGYPTSALTAADVFQGFPFGCGGSSTIIGIGYNGSLNPDFATVKTSGAVTVPSGSTIAVTLRTWASGQTGSVAMVFSVSSDNTNWSVCHTSPAQSWWNVTYSATCASPIAITGQPLYVKVRTATSSSALIYLLSLDVQLPGNCSASPANCYSCVPATSQTQWTYMTGQTCNDSNACSYTDVCRAGGLGCGGTAYVCDDGKPCTNDTCDGAGGCAFTRIAGWCIIGNACYADDALNPANDCQWCDPSINPTGWTNRPSGGGCKADAFTCTNDVCDGGGTCVHPIIAGNCLVGSVCYGNGATNPGNDCQWCASATNQTVWQPKPSGAACAMDAFGCTDDICNGASVCTHPIQTTKCLVGGVCYDNAAINPANICQWCAPPRSQTAWTNRASGTACYADSYTCTDDICDANGTCTHPTMTNKCLVANTCYDDDATSPTNDCQWCDPTASRAAWTNKPANMTCADEGFACTNDVCNGGGTCTHPIQADKCLISGIPYGAGRVAHWRFDENVGPYASDSAGTNAGTITGATWSAGKVGTSALTFDGNDGVVVPDAAALDIAGNQLTVMAWVYPTSAAGAQMIVGKGTGPQTAWLLLLSNGAPQLTVMLGASATSVGGLALTLNAWHHVVGVYDGAQVRLYVDGVRSTSANRTGNLATNAASVTIGRGASSDMWLSGRVDDIVLYGRGLTDADVQAYYAAANGGAGGQQCYANHALKADDACSWCEPTKTQVAWSPSAAGTVCADEGLPCTNDVCNATGGCTHPIKTDRCLIGGLCFGTHDRNSSNVCTWCEPASTQTAWTSSAAGLTCPDEGLTCTNDVCDGGGGCIHPIQATKCLIGGTCYNDDADNIINLCEWCDPQVTKTDWTDKPSGMVCPDDAKTCTNDVCDGYGVCVHPIQADKCLVTGTCYNTNATSPLNECQRCWPPGSQTAFSHKLGPLAAAYPGAPVPWPAGWNGTTNANACSADPHACTTDVCDGFGGCAHIIQTTHCFFGGSCRPDGAPNGMCEECEPSASQTAWSWMVGKLCNDGESCTHTDRCLADRATCRGTEYGCSDGLDCTSDVCRGDGTCTNARLPDWCKIANVCFHPKDANPANPCQWCDDLAAPEAWTNVPPDTKSQVCYPCTSSPGIGLCKAGIQWCASGAWAACGGHICPAAEQCDELDNDCDRTTDEDWPTKNTACDGGDVDACTGGRFICKPDRTGVRCEDGPIAFYRLNEGAGAAVAPAQGLVGNGGVNGATWSTAGVGATPALVFDGVNDYVDVPHHASLELTAAVTLSAWIYPEAGTGTAWRTIAGLHDGGQGGYYMAVNFDQGPGFSAWLGAACAWKYSNRNPPLGTWTHVAMTYNGAEVKLYMDGTLVATHACAGNGGRLAVSTTSPLHMGGLGAFDPALAPWRGRLDDVAVYAAALTAEQVKSLARYGDQCDALDNDCDGATDEIDYPDLFKGVLAKKGAVCDGDDYDLCVHGTYTCSTNTLEVECRNENPREIPESCNGNDDDCHGDLPANEHDDDTDGFMICEGDCDDQSPAFYPTRVEHCDGFDNDCNDEVPVAEQDLDADAHMACIPGQPTANGTRLQWADCDDTNPDIHKDAIEYCNNLDDDCDGKIDMLDPNVVLFNIATHAPIGVTAGSTIDVYFFGENFQRGELSIDFGYGITVNSITVVSDRELRANITAATESQADPRLLFRQRDIVLRLGTCYETIPDGFDVVDPAEIPTLSEWGVMLLAALLLALAVRQLRRRERRAAV